MLRRLAVVLLVSLCAAQQPRPAVADVPPKVAINDAVELAKEYGGEKSPAFVNAVLDRIWKAGDSEGVSNLDGEGAS